ncbi:MAG: SURF1 family protein [Gemmatimonadales bacterium]
MKPRDIAFVAFGSVLTAAFISLGFWQISRLGERRAFNDELRSRAETPPVGISQVPTDTGAAHFRRVTLEGKYDFAHQIILTNRTRNGSPGVNIITPMRIAGTDTAVLVNRGWIYAPDGMTVDLSKWVETDSVSGEGFVENFHRLGDPTLSRRPNAYRWMDHGVLSRTLPYPVSNFFVVIIADGKPQKPKIPPRLDVPPLDEGSHMNYAVQWFSFAAISIIGMFLFVRRK